MSEDENGYKTLSVKPEVKEKLGKIGRKEETWSEIIMRLIKNFEEDRKT